MWFQSVTRLRSVVAVAALVLLVFATGLAVLRAEPLALVGAVGIWLWVAKEGYLLLFSLAALITILSAGPQAFPGAKAEAETEIAGDPSRGIVCAIATVADRGAATPSA